MKLIVTALTAIAMWAIYVGVWERRIERQPAVMELASFEQQEYLKYLESIGDRECCLSFILSQIHLSRCPLQLVLLSF